MCDIVIFDKMMLPECLEWFSSKNLIDSEKPIKACSPKYTFIYLRKLTFKHIPTEKHP